MNEVLREYEVLVVLRVKVEAFDQEDARDMIDDHYGKGSGGEGVNVTSVEYAFK